MSRHRRQASQVLPPELIAGDEPPRANDQLGTGHLSKTPGHDDTSTRRTANPHSTTEQEASIGKSPAPEKKPPAGRST